MRFATCNILGSFLSGGAERAFCCWGVPRGFREAGDEIFLPGKYGLFKAFLHIFIMGILTTCAKMPPTRIKGSIRKCYDITTIAP